LELRIPHSRPLPARVHGHHLPRVDPLRGIEDPSHAAHRGERVAVEDEGHVAQLVEPNAVLPGDGAPRHDASGPPLTAASLRPRRSRSRARASSAARTERAAWSLTMASALAASAATESSTRPSSSTSSTAAASRGYPAAYTESSTAWMQERSIISSAAGTSPAPMIADTASPAARSEVKSASSVRTARGRGTSRTVMRVATPKLPSEPTNRETRSGPHGSPPALPRVPTRPSPRTTSSARMWLVVTPYLRQCGPPAFSATLPPRVQAVWLDGSGA